MEKLTIEEIEEIDNFREKNKIKRCHNCGSILIRKQRSEFVNVSLGLHYTFCRRKCKIEWIFKQQKIRRIEEFIKTK